MEAANSPDGCGEFATTIPDNIPINKQAVAAEEIPKGQMPLAVENSGKAAAGFFDTETLKAALAGICGELVFDDRFYLKAADCLKTRGLGGDYLSWLYDECLKREPGNLRGLYYALFFQGDMLALFRGSRQRQETKKITPANCPVCGAPREPNHAQCRQCNFSLADARDKRKIHRHKQFRLLSPEDRATCEREQSELFALFVKNPGQHEAINDKWEAIERKYHLLE
jgi:hypothetical protein